jgi:hypothetical protein
MRYRDMNLSPNTGFGFLIDLSESSHEQSWIVSAGVLHFGADDPCWMYYNNCVLMGLEPLATCVNTTSHRQKYRQLIRSAARAGAIWRRG